jgi:hypothetical protein
MAPFLARSFRVHAADIIGDLGQSHASKAAAGTLKPTGAPLLFSALTTALDANDRAIERLKRAWSFRKDPWAEDFIHMVTCAFTTGKIQAKVFPRQF